MAEFFDNNDTSKMRSLGGNKSFGYGFFAKPIKSLYKDPEFIYKVNNIKSNDDIMDVLVATQVNHGMGTSNAKTLILAPVTFILCADGCASDPKTVAYAVKDLKKNLPILGGTAISLTSITTSTYETHQAWFRTREYILAAKAMKEAKDPEMSDMGEEDVTSLFEAASAKSIQRFDKKIEAEMKADLDGDDEENEEEEEVDLDEQYESLLDDNYRKSATLSFSNLSRQCTTVGQQQSLEALNLNNDAFKKQLVVLEELTQEMWNVSKAVLSQFKKPVFDAAIKTVEQKIIEMEANPNSGDHYYYQRFGIKEPMRMLYDSLVERIQKPIYFHRCIASEKLFNYKLSTDLNELSADLIKIATMANEVNKQEII